MIVLICIVLLLITALYFGFKKYNKLKTENTNISKENEELKNKYSSLINIDEEYNKINNEIKELQEKYKEKYIKYKELQEKLNLFNDEVKILDSGLYTPQYNYETSAIYKKELNRNCQEQKNTIKNNEAIICKSNWSIEGNIELGKELIEAEKALLLNAFNARCQEEIQKVKWYNIKDIQQRIEHIFIETNKIAAIHDMQIIDYFLILKKEQLLLTYENQIKIQEEKEEQRLLREQQKEEEKLRKEVEKAQKELEEERKRIEEKEIQEKYLRQKMQEAFEQGRTQEAEKYKEQLNQKEAENIELKQKLADKERAVSDAQQTKAGTIYIISNIGSFGENVYKIGMTRRGSVEEAETGTENDRWKERVEELNSASLPFRFDIHGYIKCKNVPDIENKLHDYFNKKRTNRINMRKEFFNVTLEEIEKAITEITGKEAVILERTAAAEEYYQTKRIIEQESNIEPIQTKKVEDDIPENI